MKRPILDTDVVIDYLRKQPDAVAFVKSRPMRPLISAVTVGELYSGVKEGQERTELDGPSVALRVIPVTREIGMKAGLHRLTYRKSHGVQLADALIAATAEEMDAELFTLNTKHFPMLPDVKAPYQKA